MHGRLKIKTSAQQEEEKKKERKIKLAGYRAAMTKIMSNRKEGVQDDSQLKLTGQVLVSNPDIHTLWNIRKECVINKIEAVDEASEKDIVWMKEVELTSQCLMTNPKSYGAWHHRQYSLEKMSSPPWEQELVLCDKFLTMDERNFHCWDYRQVAAKRAASPPEEELQFTMERINNNFSNYSAWHYRSKLLPQVHPNTDPNQSQILTDEAQNEELELVQNAAFTDPEDSSAWFYLTWLVEGQSRSRSRSSVSEATKAVLLEQLDNCQQLLELEPDSKWPNYIKILLMKILDSQTYQQDIVSTFDKLKDIDPMRKNYYEDMKNKFMQN